jgi:aminomethyltransferase
MEAAAGLLKTPLYDWHVSAKAKIADFAGYAMPIQYASIVAEHEATRNRATLFDVSHMGRFRFDGPRADQLLDHLVTRRVTDMQVGEVRYALVCNASGGILDDVLVYCLEAQDGNTYFLLVVNAGNRDKISNWLQPHLADFPDVTFRDVSNQTAMIAVQGPKAVEIASKLYKVPVANLGYYRVRVADQFGKSTIVSRTGYTGEDGFELIVRNEDAVRVWENLLLAGREYDAIAAGLGARDTLRLEAAMPLYGHELSESINPFQAGLARVVNFKGRDFIGAEELQEISSIGTRDVRVGLKFEGKRAAREGSQVYAADGRLVGVVTSGSYSPTLGYPVAMAYVDRDLVVADTPVEVDVRGSRISGKVVSLPFYKRK